MPGHNGIPMGLVQQPVDGVPKQGHVHAIIRLLPVAEQTVLEKPQSHSSVTSINAPVSSSVIKVV